ncbi:MAG: 4Fe-4S dicluster domain-containing protein [Planctomycetota bacterium]
MATIKVKDNNPVGVIQELLGSMLERQLVSAVLVPQEIPSGKSVVQTLVRDRAKLETANPLAPVFAVNSARIVAQMCVDQMTKAPSAWDEAEPEQEQAKQAEAPSAEDDTPDDQAEQGAEQDQTAGEEQTGAEVPPSADVEATAAEPEQKAGPIALVLRPCEIRALIELVKLQQATLEPFLVVGVDCWGAYSVQDYAAKAGEGAENSSVTAEFLKRVTAGNLPENLCGACQVCQYPAPTYADIAIRLVGEDVSQQISVDACTDLGKEVFDTLGLEVTPQSDRREKALEELKEQKKKLTGQDQAELLETISSLCVNCKNCRAVCPICYCRQCVFDGNVFKYPLEKYLTWSGKKGVLTMPPDKLLFHLTRMSHVATSCVACGRCESACPNGIPLGRIYQKISTAAQEALSYAAGRSLDEDLPLTTFRENELSVVEN